jgi:hypothetical protein
MADTDPNAAPPVDELAQLREFAGAVRKALALGDEADSAAVLSALGNTTKERDDAKARAASIESAWASEKVAGALRSALADSGIKPEFMDDALLRATPLFTVTDKGEVVTKADAADTVPGVAPAAWIQGELKAKAPRYWPLSQGANARGGGLTLPDPAGADACFDPRSPAHNFTAQLQYEARFGYEAANRARAKYRHHGKGFV